MERDEIFAKIKFYMTSMFDAPAELVTYEANLQDDLDLDSIDAVDLIVKLQELTGRKFSPDEFKNVRTVNDIVEKVQDVVNA